MRATVYGEPYRDVDFDTEVKDATAVFRQIMKLPQIDRNRIYGFGFSMGGVVAPYVADKQDGMAGLIVWGTISRPLVEYMIDAVRAQGMAAGISPADATRQVRLTIRFFEFMLSGLSPTEIVEKYPSLRAFVAGGKYVQGKTAEYWRQMDSTLYWKHFGQGTVPTLVLFGQHDMIASPRDTDQIITLAQAGGRQDVHAVMVPGTDHYMNTVKGAKESLEKIKRREYTFKEAVVDDAVIKWINKLEAWRAEGAPPPHAAILRISARAPSLASRA